MICYILILIVDFLIANFIDGKDQTFLDLLLAASENGSLLNDNDIQEEVNTFIFAVNII